MKKVLIVIVLLVNMVNVFADGLMVSEDENYPGVYLRNKSTSVEVDVHGLLAKTVVTQEFENEWDREVNVVYSFPLPMDARSVRLLYSMGDTLIDAVLKVQAQTQIPGTGGGGVVSEINRYMGKNVIRLKLNNIQAKGLKRVRLSYVQKLNHYNGTVKYRYPLNTDGFVTQALDYFMYKINIHSSQTISGFELLSHPGYRLHALTDTTVLASHVIPKAYASKDLEFSYFTENEDLSLDFFSWLSDDANGYFTAVGHSEISPTLPALNHKIVFLLCNSTSMAGIKLEQSKLAISRCLEKLTEKDSFNLATFNSSYQIWNADFLPATSENIDLANTFINGIDARYGNVMDGVLQSILQSRINNSYGISSILVFTDGKAVVDPFEISEINQKKTGIFPVAIGNDFDRTRLESLASQNYGFVTYIEKEENLTNQLVQVFDKISHPLYKDVNIDVLNVVTSDIYPNKFPAIYGNSDFIISGRYLVGGFGMINIEAYRDMVLKQFPFHVEFTESYLQNETARYFWAKSAIDQLEAEILINEETDSLKAKLIELSLKHNMRCRYTAYIVDSIFEGRADDIWEGEVGATGFNPVESKYLICVYPSPANNNSIIRLKLPLGHEGEFGVLKIFDIFGKLIGYQKILLSSDEYMLLRINDIVNDIGSGNYIVVLELNGAPLDLKKISIL